MVTVKVVKIDPRAEIPKYMTEGSSGCDVVACLEEPLVIEPGRRVAVPTGLVVEIPAGFEIQVRPRSGLALRQGLTVVNTPGTIDSDYRGEVKILLVNVGTDPVTVNSGDRIAQLVVQQVERARWQEVSSRSDLEDSKRGPGGFGSTGTQAGK